MDGKTGTGTAAMSPAVMKYNAALPRARLHVFCWQCLPALQYADKKYYCHADTYKKSSRK